MYLKNFLPHAAMVLTSRSFVSYSSVNLITILHLFFKINYLDYFEVMHTCHLELKGVKISANFSKQHCQRGV